MLVLKTLSDISYLQRKGAVNQRELWSDIRLLLIIHQKKLKYLTDLINLSFFIIKEKNQNI